MVCVCGVWTRRRQLGGAGPLFMYASWVERGLWPGASSARRYECSGAQLPHSRQAEGDRSCSMVAGISTGSYSFLPLVAAFN